MIILKLNIFYQKYQRLQRRLSNAAQIIFDPQKLYIYPRNTYSYHNLSYSQEGEDMILSRFFCGKSSGFYIDIGAHHPQRFSNTYYFYLKGWRGINIDAMPNSMNEFKKIRSEDINLEVPISDCQETLTYYEFDEPALNGFCSELSQERETTTKYKINSTQQLKTYTLAEILDKYLEESDCEIDFMTIDVEGFDLRVLKSNNWNKYRPKIILIEELNRSSLHNEELSELDCFMKNSNYQLYAKSVNTLFYKRND